MQLSEKLRLLTARQKLTQEQLGARLGIAHTTVGRWIKGSSRPYDRHAQALAEILGLPVDVLMDDAKPLPGEEHLERLKEAAQKARAWFPDNMAAQEQAFDAQTWEQAYRELERKFDEFRKETARRWRDMADEIDPPVKTPSAVKPADDPARVEARAAVKRRRGHSDDTASGGSKISAA